MFVLKNWFICCRALTMFALVCRFSWLGEGDRVVVMFAPRCCYTAPAKILTFFKLLVESECPNEGCPGGFFSCNSPFSAELQHARLL